MFNQRSYTKELLDAENIPVADLYRNLYELNVINTLLGGHKVTVKGLARLLKSHKTNTPVTIADIGCGGGDTLKAVAKWAAKKSIVVNLIGIDLKADAIAYASEHCKDFANIRFVQSDYRAIPALGLQVDIYMNALFCHHLHDEQLIELLQFMQKNARLGFFINDLHRHPFAYYSIKWLTALFSKSYLVKNDAPLSVLRAFSRKDLLQMAAKAGVPVKIKWMWAFRWLISSR